MPAVAAISGTPIRVMDSSGLTEPCSASDPVRYLCAVHDQLFNRLIDSFICEIKISAILKDYGKPVGDGSGDRCIQR